MEQLINKLFGRTKLKPQVGFAGSDKVGRLWLPGKTPVNTESLSILMKLPYRGCTQLAFEDWWHVVDDQKCEVCWFGLDIDSDDNPGIDLIQWAGEFAASNSISLIRTSCSGTGLHMIWILDKPMEAANNSVAGRIVKSLAAPFKRIVEDLGIHVCQANRRMFWLDGGKNTTIYESEHMVELKDTLTQYVQAYSSPAVGLDISPAIQRYVDELRKRKVLPPEVGRSNPVYVGDAVAALREIGENVSTKSSMRGNGQVNGYVDILSNRIALWSYADGHVIWNYDDIGSMFDD